MTVETFRPDQAAPVGDTLGLRIRDKVTHPSVRGGELVMTVIGFKAGWDTSCPATVIMHTGDESIGNVKPGVFSCGARWLQKLERT